jgi:hypothetical protein
MKRVKTTFYLDNETEEYAERLRTALAEEQVIFPSTISKTAWFRIIFEAGLQEVARQTRLIQEA